MTPAKLKRKFKIEDSPFPQGKYWIWEQNPFGPMGFPGSWHSIAGPFTSRKEAAATLKKIESMEKK